MKNMLAKHSQTHKLMLDRFCLGKRSAETVKGEWETERIEGIKEPVEGGQNWKRGKLKNLREEKTIKPYLFHSSKADFKIHKSTYI